jgi:pyridoxal phosphate enzyme (YggS family)
VTERGNLDVRQRLHEVHGHITEAAERVGRPGEVALVAVTKTIPPSMIQEAYEAGQRMFGENRVQEASQKMEALSSLEGVSWHLIGHLQSNKARQAARGFSLVESVDSAALAQRLDRHAATAGRSLPILLEVNVSGETSKFGLRPEEVWPVAEEVARLSHLELRGLMTVAPLADDPGAVRPVFRRLRKLRDELRVGHGLESCEELSMGMSGDFLVAIEEGSTMVRIGRAIFGERRP